MNHAASVSAMLIERLVENFTTLVTGLTLLRAFVLANTQVYLILTSMATNGEIIMHHAKNMVGEQRANYDVSLWRRYFRRSRHNKPGSIRNSVHAMISAISIPVGVLIYG